MGKAAANIIAGSLFRVYIDDAMGKSNFRCVSLSGGTLWQAGKRRGVEVGLLLARQLIEYDPSCVYPYAPLSVYKSRCGYNAGLSNSRANCFIHKRTGNSLAVPFADNSGDFVCYLQTPTVAHYAIRNCSDKEEG